MTSHNDKSRSAAASSSPRVGAGEAARAESLYEQGMAHYQRREWRAALDYFARVRAVQPHWPGLDPLIDETSWLLQLEEVEAEAAKAPAENRPERRGSTSALRWVALLLLIGAVLSAWAWQQGWLPRMGTALQYEALYNRGQSSLAVGDYAAAKAAFTDLAQSGNQRFETLAQEGLERAARLEEIAAAYDSAQQAMNAGDWATAEAQLRAVLAVDPVYADAAQRLDLVLRQRTLDAQFKAGVAAYDNSQWNEAITRLEAVSELDSNYQRDAVRELLFIAYLGDGRALLATPDAHADAIRQAIARFGKALALRPRNIEASEERQLASAYLDVRQALDREDWAQAENALATLLQARSDYASGQAAELYYRLLLRRAALLQNSDSATAIALYRQAAALPVADAAEALAALQGLQAPTAVAASSDPAPTPFVEIAADTLNVRLGPGTDYPVAGQLKAGDVLALAGRNEAGDWLVVCCIDGKPGWVAARLVSPSSPIADLPVGLAPTRLPQPTAAPTATSISATPTPTPTPTAETLVVTPTPPPPPGPTSPPPTATPPPR